MVSLILKRLSVCLTDQEFNLIGIEGFLAERFALGFVKVFDPVLSLTGSMLLILLFKNVVRTEAFLFLYFVAMIIQALIESDVRISMKDQGISNIPVYFEERECSSTTAYRILSKFDNILLDHILVDGMDEKHVSTDISNTQRKILFLLHIEENRFRPA